MISATRQQWICLGDSEAGTFLPLFPSAACVTLTFQSCRASLHLCQSFKSSSLSHPFCTFQLSLNSAFALHVWWNKNNLNSSHLVLCAHPLTEHWRTKTNRFSSCVRDWAHKPGEEALTDLQKKCLWWLFGDRFLSLLPNNFHSLVLKAMCFCLEFPIYGQIKGSQSRTVKK